MLEKAVKFLKEYLSVIAITPLILGGLWQVLSLASISPSYIRFFSVSQQISDGILILFVIIVLCVVVVLTKFNLFKEISIEDWIRDSTISLILRILFNFLFITIPLSLFYMGVYFPISKGKLISLIDVIFFMIAISLVVSTLYRNYIYTIAILKKYNIKKLSISLYRDLKIFIFALIFVAVLAAIMFFLVKSISIFHKMFTFPSNLKNIQYILDKYCTDNKGINRDSVEVMYMNDKYIFIKDSSKIEVVKFDYMFK